MADTESCSLYLPALEDLAGVLECGLKRNYAEVLVKVVDCPDLTLEPFRFPVKGLCGKSRIVDVGGVPYLVPTARLDKIYNMNTVAKKIDLPGAYLLGAGASSHNSVGMNAEMIFSIKAESATSPAVNCNYMASVNPTDNGCLLEKCKEKYSDYDFGLLSNLYASEGKPGKVIEVKVKRRTGKENFVSCMRKSLKAQYGDKSVGMGGSFIIQEGKAKLHIMIPGYRRELIIAPLSVPAWNFHFVWNSCGHLPGFVERSPG
ncbi:ester hydrolase C11orf54 homolog isoform X3 [Ranitomeya imitator]|uniref:ester hydrolase C11orf54 homolog isoform X3 n=1 Tax=Ranitomeya imitator TaxID=111125 RepID=UPI0037E6FC02